MKTVGLLDLSSDLRNRIYRIAANDADYIVEKRLSRRTTSVVDDTFFKARGYYGLTQTCRLIRAEFRPQYLKDRIVSVHIRDAEEYLETVVSPELIRREESIGWLSIRTDDERNDDYPRRLRPLLQRLLGAPNLQFRFTLDQGPSVFNNSFVRHHAEWKTALENDIKTVDVEEPTHWGLHLVLNSASKLPWVKRSLRAWVRMPHMGDEALEFFATLGLPLESEMIFIRRGTGSKVRNFAHDMTSSSKTKRGGIDRTRFVTEDDAGSIHSKRPLLVPESRSMSVVTSLSQSTTGRAP